jgi:pimeloyl-ACP methyl ester carboxylesterase
MTFDLPPGSVSADVTGDGPAILRIHAFPLSGAMWRPQVHALTGFRHVVLDLPGFGASPPLKEGALLTMETGAEIADGVLDRLKIKAAAVVGLSMGGYILLAMLRTRPARVRAAILADTRAGADSEEGKANRAKLADSVLSEGPAFAARALLPKVVAAKAGSPVANEVEGLMLTATAAGVAAASRGMATRIDSTPHLAKVAVPTLVLCGSADVLTPPAESRKIADAIPGARTVEIPDAGHISNLERPDEFTAAIRRFLAENPA